VRCGLDTFTGDTVAIMMADGSDSPAHLVRYSYILRGRSEYAFGSRFMPGSRVVEYRQFKRVVNRLANIFIRVQFRLRYTDITNA
jgi:dolichol-phosphate mannosyltransferase